MHAEADLMMDSSLARPRARFHFLSLVWLAAVILSGCAAYPQHKLPTVASMPATGQFKNKPNVYLDVHFYTGKPADAPGENPRAQSELRSLVEQVVKDNQLFDNYTFE